uniref:LHFPL tetraspan subfamily member 2 n=1 Tax=Fundulus heteroclitus TaxID=8078 RepID=A0A3Q2R2P8_FUNHE
MARSVAETMCHVIVTCRSMLWTLLSIVVAFAELVAFMSSDWLLGFPRSESGVDKVEVDVKYRPSLGLYSRCLRIGVQGVGLSCGPYAETFWDVASEFWQAAMLFLAAGTLVLGCVACVSIFTLCFQSIKRKSIFNICGLLQAIGGKHVLVLSNWQKCSHINKPCQAMAMCAYIYCIWNRVENNYVSSSLSNSALHR